MISAKNAAALWNAEAAGNEDRIRNCAKAKELIESGTLQHRNRRYEDAITTFEQALQFAEEGDGKELEEECVKWIGDAYMALGKFRLARDFHQKHVAMVAARTIPNKFSDPTPVPEKPEESTELLRLGSAMDYEPGRENDDESQTLSRDQIEAAIEKAQVKKRHVFELLIKEGKAKRTGGVIDRVQADDLDEAIRRVKTYRSDQYWIDRAKIRVSKVYVRSFLLAWNSNCAYLSWQD
mmetsp:Transcript_10744/g.16846  ORF Transcript_10744/g.16846 Transcript_10744/m.16846 type:complete len:237 (+) Transcript_10744:527-1237(+)